MSAINGVQAKETSFQDIVNKNEKRVKELLPVALESFPRYKPELLDIQDIYALALNKLKPRYKQKGTLVLSEPITDAVILLKVKQAIRRVKRNPNHA